MARVPVVLALHARSDLCSSFRDVEAIIERAQEAAWEGWEESSIKLVQVPNSMANSDHPQKRRQERYISSRCRMNAI